MSNKEFNVVKAAFYLVAFVIVAHVVGALIQTAFRMWSWRGMLTPEAKPVIEICTKGNIFEILSAALAAALAFAGGKIMGNGRRPEDNKKNEDNKKE